MTGVDRGLGALEGDAAQTCVVEGGGLLPESFARVRWIRCDLGLVMMVRPRWGIITVQIFSGSGIFHELIKHSSGGGVSLVYSSLGGVSPVVFFASRDANR